MPSTDAASRFNRAASSYDAHAHLQYRVAQTLSASLPASPEHPGQWWLDAGCGTGNLSRLLPGYSLLGIDAAPAMCGEANRHGRYPTICGDITALPLREHRIGGYLSSLCWQWVGMEAAIAEAYRVLTPGAPLRIATLTSGTFGEWEASLAALDLPAQTIPFLTHRSICEQIEAGGFWLEAATHWQEAEHYSSAAAFFTALRAIGATAPRSDSSPLSIPALCKAMRHYENSFMTANGLPVTYEITLVEARRA